MLRIQRFNPSAFAAAASLLAFAGCSNIEQAKPQPQQARADRSIPLDVPQILRGTIASETILLGYELPTSSTYLPVIARGYGLVVGLNGTGSRDMPPQVRAHMLAEASRGGFGSEKFGPNVAELKPERLLDSEDTAVVVVEAIVPQGAVKGTRFDVRVSALGSTSTTSLEGGTLYTTILRPGPLNTGGGQAFELARARGPVFVNPFAEPGAVNRDTVPRTSGRVLEGGVVVKDMPLKLRLVNPSHARAEMLQSAINGRFPQEPGQRDTTARGENDELIEIHVPPSWAQHTDEFIEVLRHTTIVQASPEAAAMFVKRTLLTNPLVWRAASFRWQALGTKALPIIRDLYDSAEELPRIAALRAGAKLDDALVIPSLMSMARSASVDARLDAIQLLSNMASNPQIDESLRELLNDDDVEIRLACYEALIDRRNPYLHRTVVDGKFILDVVESDKPLIYITQVGEPRIVIFGQDLVIERPTTMTAWSNRFMMKADAGDEDLEVYYREQDADQGQIIRVEPKLDEFIVFLGHSTTIEEPQPGLSMTYGETVGVLHQIWRQRYVKADFKAEQDRILAAIVRQTQEAPVVERPEFSDAQTTAQGPDASQPGLSDIGHIDARPTVPTSSDAPQANPANNGQPR
jgi:hypothetical protein